MRQVLVQFVLYVSFLNALVQLQEHSFYLVNNVGRALAYMMETSSRHSTVNIDASLTFLENCNASYWIAETNSGPVKIFSWHKGVRDMANSASMWQIRVSSCVLGDAEQKAF